MHSFSPRKRRTRQHVIADMSVNHVERFVIDEGHTAQRMEKDYGYDLELITYDENGYIEPSLVWLQVKAAEHLRPSGPDFVFDLDIRDYNLWMLNELPVVLILFDASRRRAYWLHIQGYFRDDVNRRPKKGSRFVRVRVSSRNAFNHRDRCTNSRAEGQGTPLGNPGEFMKKSNVTYGQLDKVLRSLGFTCREVTRNVTTRLYEHKDSGAEIWIPLLPKDELAWPHHLFTARTTLDLYGIADPTVFEAKLQKAG
jgi:hypothetical protein